MPIRLIIVDDHPLVRESLKVFLEREPDVAVVAVCSTADDAAVCVRETAPDVVLMDIEMPGRSSFQVVRELRKEGIKARFVFLSAHLTDSFLREAEGLGDCGYLTKTASIDQITSAVRQVAQGKPYFSPEVASRRDNCARPTLSCLTARELEVLQLVASDLSCKEVAAKLGLSARTVDRHKANIMEKLGIHSQVGLTRFAVAEGVSDPRRANEPLRY